MKIIYAAAGVLLILYALSIAESTEALIVGAVGIGLLIFSDARR